MQPMLHEANSLEESNSSLIYWYKAVFGQLPDEELVNSGGGWVDVRDLASAHVAALEKEEAGGQRIIVSAGEDESSLCIICEECFNGIFDLDSFLFQDWGIGITCSGVNYQLIISL
jgi:hypothetical protein